MPFGEPLSNAPIEPGGIPGISRDTDMFRSHTPTPIDTSGGSFVNQAKQRRKVSATNPTQFTNLQEPGRYQTPRMEQPHPEPHHQSQFSYEHVEQLQVNEEKEIVPFGQNLYGHEWHVCGFLIGRFAEGLRQSEEISAPEDIAIGQAIVHLLTTIHSRDGRAYLHEDLEKFEKETQKGISKDKAQEHIAAIMSSYDIDSQQLQQELLQRGLGQYGFGDVPTSRIRSGDGLLSSDTQLYSRLYMFSSINLKITESGITLDMRGAYDGGVDSVAYPLSSITLTITEGKPLETNFERMLIGPLRSELQNHPEIITQLKKRFAEITRSYVDDEKGYIKTRYRDGNLEDASQLQGFLYDYILNSYLKSRLDRKKYQEFSSALQFARSDQIDSVIHLQVIDQQLLDANSYVRMDKFYAEEKRTEFQEFLTQTVTQLRSLGCNITEDGITNLQEIIQKARQDEHYRKRISDMWEGITQLARDTVSPLDGTLEQIGANMRSGLFNELVICGLEMARGMITQQGGQKKDTSDILFS